MASWVSPSIAADMWNMPVSEILARADRGEIQSKQEGAFTFINIDSANHTIANSPARLTPPTFSVVTHEEEMALLETMNIASARQLTSQLRKRPLAA